MSLPQLVAKPRAKMPAKQASATHNLTWNGVTYCRVIPGTYDVVGRAVQGPEWCRAYRRWSIRIEFALLAEEGVVSRFFNMGSDPEKPHIGRQSLYFKWWTAANGELPLRGQKMTPEVFFEGQVFTVAVEDATADVDKNAKHDAEVYSKVTVLQGVSLPQSSNRSIFQSGIIQSPNQAINQSSKPLPSEARNKNSGTMTKTLSFASAGRGKR
jgi:hypothetical protein